MAERTAAFCGILRHPISKELLATKRIAWREGVNSFRTKKSKYYFYDTGIRNALVSNFSPLEARNDLGALWENFLFMERIKRHSYKEDYANVYFWRTWGKQEIDLIEEKDGKLYAYEFKWSDKRAKAPSAWEKNYPDSSFEVINRDNYLDFVL